MRHRLVQAATEDFVPARFVSRVMPVCHAEDGMGLGGV